MGSMTRIVGMKTTGFYNQLTRFALLQGGFSGPPHLHSLLNPSVLELGTFHDTLDDRPEPVVPLDQLLAEDFDRAPVLWLETASQAVHQQTLDEGPAEVLRLGLQELLQFLRIGKSASVGEFSRRI